LTIFNRAIPYYLNLGFERKNVRITSLFILLKTGLVFLTFFLLASSLPAENLTFWNPSKNIGVEVSIPAWALEKKVVSKTENGIKEDGKLYSNIKIYQYDDNPSIWEKFFSIQIEEEVSDTIRVFKDIQLDVYLNYCVRESLKYNLVKQTNEQIVFNIFCPEYIKNKSNGEIAVFSMVRFKNYFVKIFQQWRGENMLANDKSTWVANDVELIETIKSLSSLNIKFEEGKK
tara:strand:- start:1572 stop:2261 length:690 start_codon:yes stop_codon:yes gene_type:complete